jgi:hypothetical protein
LFHRYNVVPQVAVISSVTAAVRSVEGACSCLYKLLHSAYAAAVPVTQRSHSCCLRTTTANAAAIAITTAISTAIDDCRSSRSLLLRMVQCS